MTFVEGARLTETPQRRLMVFNTVRKDKFSASAVVGLTLTSFDWLSLW